MKLHPREQQVLDAVRFLRDAVGSAITEFELTEAEELRVVMTVLGDQVQTIARYAIRAERREDADEPEGLEELCEPIKGWVWCEGSEVVHYSSRPECPSDHRKLWVEREKT